MTSTRQQEILRQTEEIIKDLKEEERRLTKTIAESGVQLDDVRAAIRGYDQASSCVLSISPEKDPHREC